MENNLKCPKCNSENLSADKRGFSGKNAVVGAVLTGGIGLLAGTIGSKNIIINCLNCGLKYKAKDYLATKIKYVKQKRLRAEINRDLAKGEPDGTPLLIVFIVFIIGLIISIKLFSIDWNFLGIIFSIATLLVFVFFIFYIIDTYHTKKQKKQNGNEVQERNVFNE